MFTIDEVKPLFTNVVTTANKYEKDFISEGGIIMPNKLKGQLNSYQRVLAIGDTVRSVKVGDIVRIRYDRYATVVHPKGNLNDDGVENDSNIQYSYSIPGVDLDGIGKCLLIHDQDIELVVTKWHGIDEGGLLE